MKRESGRMLLARQCKQTRQNSLVNHTQKNLVWLINSIYINCNYSNCLPLKFKGSSLSAQAIQSIGYKEMPSWQRHQRVWYKAKSHLKHVISDIFCTIFYKNSVRGVGFVHWLVANVVYQTVVGSIKAFILVANVVRHVVASRARRMSKVKII